MPSSVISAETTGVSVLEGTDKLAPDEIGLADTETVEAVEPVGLVAHGQGLDHRYLAATEVHRGGTPDVERQPLAGIGLEAVLENPSLCGRVHRLVRLNVIQ